MRKIFPKDVVQVILTREEIDLAIKYCDAIEYSAKSNTQKDRPPEQHDADYYLGKLGEILVHKYLDLIPRFIEFNDWQVKNAQENKWKKGKGTGDGGIDIKGTRIDVKASSFFKAEQWKNFYVPLIEYHPETCYVKVFFHEKYLKEFRTCSELKGMICGFAWGREFIPNPKDPNGSAGYKFNLQSMKKIKKIFVGENNFEDLKLSHLRESTLEEANEVFKLLNFKNRKGE